MRSYSVAPPAQDAGLGSKQLLLATHTPFSCTAFHPLQSAPSLYPLLWPPETEWVLGAGTHLRETGQQLWRKSTQVQSFLMPTSTPPPGGSGHFHKHCRNSLCELDFVPNLMLFNKYFCGTYGISPYLPESLGYFIIYLILSVPWKIPQSAKIDPEILVSIHLLSCT